MGFVKDPSADLPVADRLPKGAVAQLLGRDVQQGHVPQTDPVQHLAAFGRRQ